MRTGKRGRRFHVHNYLRADHLYVYLCRLAMASRSLSGDIVIRVSIPVRAATVRNTIHHTQSQVPLQALDLSRTYVYELLVARP